MGKAVDNFSNELNLISSEDIRYFVGLVLDKYTPTWFWTTNASRNHHPKDERGLGGLVLHTKRVTQIAVALAVMDNLDTAGKDILIAAALLHDTRKKGCNPTVPTPYTLEHHSILFDEDLREKFGGTLIFEDISRLVATHMGRFSPNNVPKPSNRLQDLLHIADMVAANLDKVTPWR